MAKKKKQDNAAEPTAMQRAAKETSAAIDEKLIKAEHFKEFRDLATGDLGAALADVQRQVAEIERSPTFQKIRAALAESVERKKRIENELRQAFAPIASALPSLIAQTQTQRAFDRLAAQLREAFEANPDAFRRALEPKLKIDAQAFAETVSRLMD